MAPMFDTIKNMFSSDKKMTPEEFLDEALKQIDTLSSCINDYFSRVEKDLEQMEDPSAKDRCLSHLTLFKKYAEDTVKLVKEMYISMYKYECYRRSCNHDNDAQEIEKIRKKIILDAYYPSLIYSYDLIGKAIHPLTIMIANDRKQIERIIK